MPSPLELRHERDFGQKLNATFQFVTRHFKPFSLCLLYIVAPVALLAGIVGGLYQSQVLSLVTRRSGTGSVDTSTFSIMSRFFSPEYWLTLLFSGLAGVLLSLTVCSFLAEYEAAGNRPPDVSTVWLRVRQSLGWGFLLSLALFFIILFASIFLLIPGIYLAIALSLSAMALVQERLDLGEAMSRSYRLVEGKWWSTFGLLVVVYFIVAVASYVFQLPVLIVTVLKTMEILSGDLTLPLVVATMIATVASTLLKSVAVLALGFQYFNLVELKEGTGLLQGLEQIGTTPPPTPFFGEQND